jgi:hypothetical protein
MADSLQGEQRSPYAPIPPGIRESTGLVVSPQTVQERMRHFPEEVYDTSPASHLYRFVAALAGESGAGMLKKRLLMARLASTLQGTHFYDLDRFYGALLNVSRTIGEALPIDPYTTPQTTSDWSEAMARDGSYRSRVEQFARAIQYGTSAIAMELIAEAVLSVDVEIAESFEQADVHARSYGQIESLGTYGDLQASTYGQLEEL